MHVAIIPPAVQPELARGSYHLILPQLLNDSTPYRAWYMATEGFKILDNGAAEKEHYAGEALLEMATLMGADEIVVPDVLGDAERTLERVKGFERYALSRPEFRYAGVLQGQSRKDVMRCFQMYEHMEWIDTLMLPRILGNTIHKYFRSYFIEAMYDQHIRGRFDAIHWLGATNQPREVVTAVDLPIRGIDTSVPIALAIEGSDIRWVGEYTGRPEGYFARVLGGPRLDQAHWNIRVFKEWAASMDDLEVIL